MKFIIAWNCVSKILFIFPLLSKFAAVRSLTIISFYSNLPRTHLLESRSAYLCFICPHLPALLDAIRAEVSNLLASQSHTLNTLWHIITKNLNVLSKFTILCCASFIAILGHFGPVGLRLDTPAGFKELLPLPLNSFSTVPNKGFLVLPLRRCLQKLNLRYAASGEFFVSSHTLVCFLPHLGGFSHYFVVELNMTPSFWWWRVCVSLFFVVLV